MLMWFARRRAVGCDQRCSILSHERNVILFRGRTIATSSTEAETRVGVFGRHFPSNSRGAITNHAALPDEQTAQGRARPITRQLSARRHHRRDQRQPKCLG